MPYSAAKINKQVFETNQMPLNLFKNKDSQRRNLWLPGGKNAAKRWLGNLGWTCTHTAVFKMGNQQVPTI